MEEASCKSKDSVQDLSPKFPGERQTVVYVLGLVPGRQTHSDITEYDIKVKRGGKGK